MLNLALDKVKLRKYKNKDYVIIYWTHKPFACFETYISIRLAGHITQIRFRYVEQNTQIAIRKADHRTQIFK